MAREDIYTYSYLDVIIGHHVLMLGHETLPLGRGFALDTAHGVGLGSSVLTVRPALTD